MTLINQLEELMNEYKVFLEHNSFKKVNEIKSGLGILIDFDNEKLKLDNELTDEQIRKSQRYSTKEDVEFISKEYSNLVELFSTNQVTRTKEEINKIQINRAKIKYGTL